MTRSACRGKIGRAARMWRESWCDPVHISFPGDRLLACTFADVGPRTRAPSVCSDASRRDLDRAAFSAVCDSHRRRHVHAAGVAGCNRKGTAFLGCMQELRTGFMALLRRDVCLDAEKRFSRVVNTGKLLLSIFGDSGSPAPAPTPAFVAYP
eukprot:6176913-Pleurochrysis_carterae.AAC.1